MINLSPNQEIMRSILFLLLGIPVFLIIDSPYGDSWFENGQWVANILILLAFIRSYLYSVQRVRTIMLIGLFVGLTGEFLFSKIFGMYHYRLDNIPLWLAFGHGLIFAWVYKTSRKPLIRHQKQYIQTYLLTISITYSVFWLAWANDVYGFIAAAIFLLILFTAKKSRLFFLIMFTVVCYIEQVGTATGCWYWPTTAFNLFTWLPSGNPPSGISVFYFIFDIVVFWIYLYIVNPNIGLRYQRKYKRTS